MTGLLAGLSRRQLLVVLCLCSWIALVASGYIVLGIWIIASDGSYSTFKADAVIGFLRAILQFSWETYFVALAFVHALALVMLLAPAVRPVEIRPSSRPLLWSVIGASAIGGVSSLLVLGMLAEAALALAVPPSEGKPLGEILISPLVLLPAWSISGGIWAFALRRAGRSRSPDGVDHLFRRVLAATAVESALALPLYVMIKRRSNCECALASFIGLIWGAATLVWMCGPWALLFFTRESRRNWGRAACPACGYPRKSHATVCSECGHAFAGAVAAADADA